jgi:hypothetical protein
MVQYNGQELEIQRFYFTGTTTLAEGQILAYQELTTGTTKGLGVDVEVLSSDNITVPAGIVPLNMDGVIGPGYIDLIVPRRGDIIKVLCDGTTDVVALSSLLTPDATLAGLAVDGSVTDADAMVFRSLTAFTTNATLTLLDCYCIN